MMRRTPMKRTAWARPGYGGFISRQNQPSDVEPRASSAIKNVATSRAVIARIGQQGPTPIPKENAITSPAYQSAVRRLPCIRCGIQGFTQFCHSDEGKGMAIKTDDRRGWPGCGPHGTEPGCHWYVGTSGNLKQSERRALEADYAARTRAMVEAKGEWPARLPKWEPDS